MSELFSIKNKGIRKTYIKKVVNIKKVGVLGIIFILCTTCFVSGYNINSYAASSSTVLPISRGGTNANTAAQAITNLGKVDVINSSSTNDQFPSAKAAYSEIFTAKGFKNQYLVRNVPDSSNTMSIIVLGQIPLDTSKRTSLGAVFSGEVLYHRCIPHVASCTGDMHRFTMDFVLGGHPNNVTSNTVFMKCVSRDICGGRPHMKLGTFMYNENWYVGLFSDTANYGGYGQNLLLSGFMLSIGGCADFTCPGQQINYTTVSDWTTLKQLDQ
ncbi:MAG: hypothetical protein LBT91_02095 [Bifidobacteriaceae bacterium]|jgi:hypothetical protein|nr:hypothetical protein [Bifidobacteriaceae bacterium]